MGCPAKARSYRPSKRKLDLRTVSFYFVGYSEKSRGFKFYDSTKRTFFETRNARFFEEVEFEGGDKVKDFVFEEESISLPTVIVDHDQDQVLPDMVQQVQDIVDAPINDVQQEIPEEQTQQPQEQVPIRRSIIERRSTISDDYIVFLQEHEVDHEMMEDDPINFDQVFWSSYSQKWIDAMKE